MYQQHVMPCGACLLADAAQTICKFRFGQRRHGGELEIRLKAVQKALNPGGVVWVSASFVRVMVGLFSVSFGAGG